MSLCGEVINRLKRRNPPCAAPSLSSFPMGKKLDTTERGAVQGGFLLLVLFIRYFRRNRAKNDFDDNHARYRLYKG